MPQSNQRGIETPYAPQRGRAGRGPQSNQRGIETAFDPALQHLDVQPQSNQRGIETDLIARGVEDAGQRLNRTSVGLKRHYGGADIIPVRWPQSNQRGIETKKRFLLPDLRAYASIEPAWD